MVNSYSDITTFNVPISGCIRNDSWGTQSITYLEVVKPVIDNKGAGMHTGAVWMIWMVGNTKLILYSTQKIFILSNTLYYKWFSLLTASIYEMTNFV